MDFEHIAQRLVSVSVPSIGASKPQTLEQALQRVARAERELQDARASARRVGRAAGKKLNTLFEDSVFVKRSSAEAWIDEARSESRRFTGADAEWLAIALENARCQDPRPFRMAGEALHRAHREGREFGVSNRNADAPSNEADAIAARQAEILASRRTSLAPNAAIGGPTTSAEFVSALHAAAARARSKTDSDPPPREMNALSKAILAAGEERRNPKPWKAPKND